MGRRDKGKKKAVCQGSDVFTMFEKGQLQEFKEAFEMIDSNRDGFIDKNDLKSTYVYFNKISNFANFFLKLKCGTKMFLMNYHFN